MSNSTPRQIYLVRHGEAKAKEADPLRGLTDAGRREVSKMALWAAASGIRVDAIRHSGKLRAEQTAEILAEQLNVQAEATSGLGPQDDVAAIAKALEREQGTIMLVGHLPFLERLVAQLTGGTTDHQVVVLDSGGLAALTRNDTGWQLHCLLSPRFLPGE